MSWRPTAAPGALERRAAALAGIRAFFAARGVLEVDTPLLAPFGAVDPALASFAVDDGAAGTRYLQTSPEAAMKRLLAAGSGDIYQICHAFRREERSPLHLAEFTLVEWYRTGFDHHRLMDEVADLVAGVLPACRPVRVTFGELCRRHAGLDPHAADTATLAAFARDAGAALSPADCADRALLLDFVFAHAVLRALGRGSAAFIHDFPVELAAYARLDPGPPVTAARFELVIDGIEIANGYHEVTCAARQRACYARDEAVRRARGLPPMAPDGPLLAALEHGLPACAGVALGLDRLLMLAAGHDDVRAVVAFGD